MTDIAKAKRGDLVLVKGLSSSTSFRDGTTRRHHWTFAKVTNVTRDGQVSGHIEHGGYRIFKGIPAECMIVAQSRLRELGWTSDTDSLLAALPREYGDVHPWPKKFAAPDDAKAALLAVIGASVPTAAAA